MTSIRMLDKEENGGGNAKAQIHCIGTMSCPVPPQTGAQEIKNGSESAEKHTCMQKPPPAWAQAGGVVGPGRRPSLAQELATDSESAQNHMQLIRAKSSAKLLERVQKKATGNMEKVATEVTSLIYHKKAHVKRRQSIEIFEAREMAEMSHALAIAAEAEEQHKSRESGMYGQARQVRTSLRLLNLLDIDTVNESFKVSIELHMSWDAPPSGSANHLLGGLRGVESVEGIRNPNVWFITVAISI